MFLRNRNALIASTGNGAYHAYVERSILVATPPSHFVKNSQLESDAQQPAKLLNVVCDEPGSQVYVATTGRIHIVRIQPSLSITTN